MNQTFREWGRRAPLAILKRYSQLFVVGLHTSVVPLHWGEFLQQRCPA